MKRNKECILSEDLKREHWGDGEWVHEADVVTWEYKGVKCRIHRIARWEKDQLCGGYFCGYISLPDDHPWAKEDPFSIDCDAHGGITFGKNHEDDYWIGFDCAHSMDVIPSMIKQREKIHSDLLEKIPSLKDLDVFKSSYKNIAFCIKECENLADQILEAKK